MRDAMLPWKENVHLPLVIDIFYDGAEQSRIHLERWTVIYMEKPIMNENNAAYHENAHLNEDVLKGLREVCKKAAMLLRALYSLMRQLPLHRLHFASYPPCLSYRLHSTDDTDQLISKIDETQQGSFGTTESVRRYAFLPISTPFGCLEVTGLYRVDIVESLIALKDLNCSPKILFQPDVIIQDYVSPSGMSGRMQQSEESHRSRTNTLDEKQESIEQPPEEEERKDRPSVQHGSIERRLCSENLTPRSPRRSLPKTISQPMAIPVRNGAGGNLEIQHLSSPSQSRLVSGGPENDLISLTENPTHPRSFGECNRYQEADVNIVAAPFGYKNVAVHDARPSIGSSQSSGNSSVSHWNNRGANIYGIKEAPRPKSTPPIHPSSLTGPRIARRRTFTPSLDSAGQVGGALENFSLDSELHATSNLRYAQTHTSSNMSPTSANLMDHVRVLTEKTEKTRQDKDEGRRSSNSTMTTPPFSCLDSPCDVNDSYDEATTIVRSACDKDYIDNTCATQKSPPFRANPCELYTTPGFTYRPHDQAFVARTDQYQPNRREVNTQTLTSKDHQHSKHTHHSKFRVNYRSKRFSTDVFDQQSFRWGISSPDSAETFHLVLPLGREKQEQNSETFQANAIMPYEAEDHDLPFAISDTGSFLSTEKLTDENVAFHTDNGVQHASINEAANSNHETIMLRSSASQAEWKTTVSVSKFLHQLNHAPNLEICITTSQDREVALPLIQASSAASQQIDNVAVGNIESDKASGIMDLYNDELNAFKKLRDDLTSQLGYETNPSETSRPSK